MLPPTDQDALRQLDSLHGLEAKDVFLQRRKKQFVISLGSPCSLRRVLGLPWGTRQPNQPGSKVGPAALLLLLQRGVNPGGSEAFPWGHSSGPFIFGSLLELVALRNRS